MATDPSIKVVKSMTYRGATRFFSNRYHFDNLVPADNTKWTTLSDAVVTAEKATYWTGGQPTIVATYGYDAGSDVPIFSKTYSTAGTGAFTGGANTPGDCAALVRYSTGQRTPKNHPIYLFNYVHGAVLNSSGAIDTLNTVQKAALLTYGAAWVAGFSDGAVTHHRCGPNGHVATGVTVDSYVRHRDFPSG